MNIFGLSKHVFNTVDELYCLPGFNTEAIPNAIKLAISSQHSIISEFDSQKRFYQYFKYLLFFLHVSITIERGNISRPLFYYVKKTVSFNLQAHRRRHGNTFKYNKDILMCR